jgi:riboflavin transporter FmnP
MNSKKISILIVFAALTVFLNISPIKIPAPYAPFLIYQLWEIPIVTVSLLYGFQMGISVSIINTLILLLIYPGALPTGPIYNFIAVLSMLSGIYIAEKLSGNFIKSDKRKFFIISSTFLGTIMRVIAMTVINWIVLPFPPPIGFSIPPDIALTFLPLIGFFNATLTLYTIPLGAILAKSVKIRLNINQ